MNFEEAPDVMRVEDAAAILHISKNRAYEEIALFNRTGGKDGLPAVRIGRILRVPKTALREWIDSQASGQRFA